MIERKSSTNRRRYLSNQTKYWFLWQRKMFLLELPNLLSQQLIHFLPYFNIPWFTKLYVVYYLGNSHKYFMYFEWFDRKPGPFKTVRNHSPTLLLFYDKHKNQVVNNHYLPNQPPFMAAIIQT